ncbi:iron-containing alcohol dehydrogenase [Pseudorhodoferax sp.]|uniref:iron-containing alcohol dehydrogenase n=1 Tax=Pseudorhodoferax sp. TaxID=1993553 RepID=UPI002DD6AE34|nr:iron-containing alcohol dehydrogenase [Pseudorhodoferax sp.]
MIRQGEFRQPAIESVVFGRAAGDVLRDKLDAAGLQRAFLVSGRSLGALQDGPLQRIEAALGGRVAGRFAGVRAHTPREDVVAAALQARDAHADVVIAVGGGSVIDAAKGVLVCLWMGIDDPDALDPLTQIVAPPSPIRLLSVSTTLSAAEFTPFAGITHTPTQTKQAFPHPLLVPRTVVLDPAAPLHTPMPLLRSTAVRSVDHAVETWCSPMAHAGTEALSLQGLTLLARALRRMGGDQLDAEAALDAQFGMWQAILPASAGVPTGASHGIGYALGAGFGVGHGETSCVMLPAVMQWNARMGDARQSRLAAAMEQPGVPLADALRALIGSLGLPTRLRDVGIREADFPEIARRALQYPSLAASAHPVTTIEQVQEILQLAW